MTHTLHREGDLDSLLEDFIVLQMPGQRRTSKGSGEKNRRFIELAIMNNAVNISHETLGARYTLDNADELLSTQVVDSGSVHAVFSTPENLISFLLDLRKEDLGYSTVVSGLRDVVKKCCNNAGLKPHTVNLSLGIYGKTEKLLPNDIREVTSMCGHGMVTDRLVLQMVDGISNGRITAKEGAEKLTSLCPCGVFNPVRCEKLLARMAQKKASL